MLTCQACYPKKNPRDTPHLPKTIISDNGGEATGKEMQALLTEYGIKHLRTQTYSPQQNSFVERLNRN